MCCNDCKYYQDLDGVYYCYRSVPPEDVDADYDCEDYASKTEEQNEIKDNKKQLRITNHKRKGTMGKERRALERIILDLEDISDDREIEINKLS